MKIMKIYEIAASWDRVKVSIGAGPRQQTLPSSSKPRTPEINAKQLKSIKNVKTGFEII